MTKGKSAGLTHFDKDGRPHMVDVSQKAATARMATARGAVTMSAEAMAHIIGGDNKKGDPIAVAELAGIMAVKRTADLIPLCHPLPVTNVKLHTDVIADERRVVFHATVKTTGQTGVEMEALTGVSVACLTLYDMLKAVDKSMQIGAIALVEKSGGASGDFRRGAADQ